MNSPKIKDLKDIESEINKWEETVKILGTQFCENLSNGMNIAIFTNMMPALVQDYVYTHVVKDTLYATLKDRVKVLVSNTVGMNMGPGPMDIGNADDQHAEIDENWDYEVDAVGAQLQCHRCRGFEHIARECATKGKGNGGLEGRNRRRQGELQRVWRQERQQGRIQGNEGSLEGVPRHQLEVRQSSPQSGGVSSSTTS